MSTHCDELAAAAHTNLEEFSIENSLWALVAAHRRIDSSTANMIINHLRVVVSFCCGINFFFIIIIWFDNSFTSASINKITSAYA